MRCLIKEKSDEDELYDIGLLFFSNLIRFNFSNLNDKDISKILELLYDIVVSEKGESNLEESILNILDIILRYGFIPDPCLEMYLRIIGSLYFSKKDDEKILNIFKNLFKSHYAYKTFDILCEFICNFNNGLKDTIKTGLASIDIISHLFYSSEPYKLTTFNLHNSTVFKAFIEASSKKDRNVLWSIMSTLVSIFNYQFNELGYLEWDMILDILYNVQEEIEIINNKTGGQEEIFEDETRLCKVYNHFLSSIFKLLENDKYFGDYHRTTNLLRKNISERVTEFNLKVLAYFNDRNFYLPCTSTWMEDLSKLLVIYINSKDYEYKKILLDIIINTYHCCKEFHTNLIVEKFIFPLIQNIHASEDPKLLFEIFKLCLDAILDNDFDGHIYLFNLLVTIINPEIINMEGDIQEYAATSHLGTQGDLKSIPATISLSYIYLLSLKHHNDKNIRYLFQTCLRVLAVVNCTTSKLILINVLSGLRADSNLNLCYSDEFPEQSCIEHLFEHFIFKRELTNEITNCIFLPFQNQKDDINDFKFDCIKLNFELKLFNEASSIKLKESNPLCDNEPLEGYIPMKLYLNLLNEMLEVEVEWRVFCLALKRLSDQLSNQPLFIGCHLEINKLRQNLCNWITSNKLAESIRELPDHYKRGDLYVMAYKLLNSLISYKSHFSKSERDEIILAYQVGLRKWTQTCRLCIHSLTICCYELPLSMTKLLPSMLIKLSQIMSTATISAHILEFLVCLARRPNLYANFVDDDFKRVFGIALQYIQYNSNNKSNTNNNNKEIKSLPTSPSSRAPMPIQNNEEAHMKYVLVLAYQVISIWFVNLRLSDRSKFIPFIVRGLYKANLQRGKSDEITDSCLDMLASYCFSNFSEFNDPLIDKLFRNCANLNKKHYVLNDMLIVVEGSKELPWIRIIVRRASSYMVWLCEFKNEWFNNDELKGDVLNNLMQKFGFNEQKFFNQTILNAENEITKQVTRNASSLPISNKEYGQDQNGYKSSEILINRGILIGTNNNINYFDPGFLYLGFSNKSERIVDGLVLNDSTAVSRSIGVLDRMPIVDFHKIGVLYVGPNQTNEVDILSNETGCMEYKEFIKELGDIVLLKGNQGQYLGGLDTEMNFDGYYTLVWNSILSKVVFHIATLMPTQLDKDPKCSFKKRHIGNDYVTIVFNNSGKEYQFDTLPGQFNLINLILTPLNKFCNQPQYFKIQAQVRQDLPVLSPVFEAKIVSHDKAALLIRQLALNASIFAQLFLKGGDYLTNYMIRLAQLRLLKDRLK
ncbi:hypothetical protein K502DRAFT_324807 [Neoconidiobolus thromboides FSU 785]|nr:hypothetical protein K502DRAFT_324807 [Neoconidiobolus thromboides FSU 785]